MAHVIQAACCSPCCNRPNRVAAGNACPCLQPASRPDLLVTVSLANRFPFSLQAMESLRLLVRQDHVSTVQVACGIRKASQRGNAAVVGWSTAVACCGAWWRLPAAQPPLLQKRYRVAFLSAPHATPAIYHATTCHPAPQLLSPSQWARLVVAAWPFYPDPSKWAPLLVAEANAAKGT